MASAGPNTRGRRFWIAVTLVVLLGLVAIGTGIGWVVYAHTYQPLSDFGGYNAVETPNTVHWTDTAHGAPYRLVGAAGTTGVVIYDVSNDGSHPVRLLGVDPLADPVHVIAGAKWSPSNGPPPYFVGSQTQARDFPMTLDPNQHVILQLTIKQTENCNGGTITDTAVPVRWSALGVHHLWRMPLYDAETYPDGPPAIDACLS
jgi:hypothetical protein